MCHRRRLAAPALGACPDVADAHQSHIERHAEGRYQKVAEQGHPSLLKYRHPAEGFSPKSLKFLL
jgi:hypothetical protein